MPVESSSTAATRTTIRTDVIVNAHVTGGNILEFFPQAQNDGLYVSFSHGSNSLDEMDAALVDGECGGVYHYGLL